MITQIRRAVAAAALTAAGLTGTVALATPAFAADTVRVSAGTLIATGGPEATNLIFEPVGDLIQVREFNDTTMTAGPGCIQITTRKVQCRGVRGIDANGHAGVDVLDNKTTLPSVLNGDADPDVLIGGPRNDHLIGGSGTDNANGGPGQDICDAEGETNCELD